MKYKKISYTKYITMIKVKLNKSKKWKLKRSKLKRKNEVFQIDQI